MAYRAVELQNLSNKIKNCESQDRKPKLIPYPKKLLEPCAVEAACTVLMGGKSEKIYLSKLGQRVRRKSKLKLISGGVMKMN